MIAFEHGPPTTLHIPAFDHPKLALIATPREIYAQALSGMIKIVKAGRALTRADILAQMARASLR